jgi:hypothetical protein
MKFAVSGNVITAHVGGCGCLVVRLGAAID